MASVDRVCGDLDVVGTCAVEGKSAADDARRLVDGEPIGQANCGECQRFGACRDGDYLNRDNITLIVGQRSWVREVDLCWLGYFDGDELLDLAIGPIVVSGKPDDIEPSTPRGGGT